MPGDLPSWLRADTVVGAAVMAAIAYVFKGRTKRIVAEDAAGEAVASAEQQIYVRLREMLDDMGRRIAEQDEAMAQMRKLLVASDLRMSEFQRENESLLAALRASNELVDELQAKLQGRPSVPAPLN